MNNRDLWEKWAEFHIRKWGCSARVVRWDASNSAAWGEGLFFFNRKSHLYLPPLNPYHPFAFHPTPTDKPYKLNRQWHEAAKVMIPDLLKAQRGASFVFPPEVADIRPFLWSGFKAEVKYTYLVKLPYAMGGQSVIKGTTAIRLGNIREFVIGGNELRNGERGIWTWQSAENGRIENNVIRMPQGGGIDLTTYLRGYSQKNILCAGNRITAASFQVKTSSLSNANVVVQ